MKSNIGITFAILSTVVSACGEPDPQKQLQELTTLAATAGMTVEEWIAGSLPDAYASQSLDANRRAQEAALSRLEKNGEDGAIAEAARRIVLATQEAEEHIHRQDRTEIKRQAAAIRAAVDDLHRLSTP
jgi:hypothetical protein